MANPLPEAKTAIATAQGKRKELLINGGGEFSVWKPPEAVRDTAKAMDAASDIIGEALPKKDHINLPLYYRQANLTLLFSRDYNRARTDRVARAGEYLRMVALDAAGNLDARVPKV